MGRLRYDVYVDDKKLVSYFDRDIAIRFCKDNAANNIELLKRHELVPELLKRENVDSLHEIPSEVRYKYYTEKTEAYLKKHFKIKIVDTTPTEEEKERRRKLLEKVEKDSKGKKVRI